MQLANAITKSIADSLYIRIENYVPNDTLHGDRTPDERVYTTTHNFVEGSTRLFLNGQRLAIGVDYEELQGNEIRLNFALYEDDVIVIDYIKKLEG